MKEKIAKMYHFFFLNKKKMGQSQENYEREMQQRFDEQREKERLAQLKKEEAAKTRENLQKAKEDKYEAQIQKYYQKSKMAINSKTYIL